MSEQDFPIDPIENPMKPSELRLHVEKLFDSYHATDVDFIAENVQNAVDALEEKFSGEDSIDTQPKIEIEINTEENIFTIRDNGKGLSEEVISKIGKPVNSDKDQGSARGYKGVGLSFAAWTSENFKFATKRPDENELVSGVLSGARSWVEGDSDDYPVVQETEFGEGFLDGEESGAVFEFHLGENTEVSDFIQRLNREGIRTLLKAKTAIGYVNIADEGLEELPDWAESAKVKVDISGRSPIEIEFGFSYPHQLLGKDFNLENTSNLSAAELDSIFGTKKIIWEKISHDDIRNLFADDEELSHLLEVIEAQKVSAYGAFVDQRATLKDLNEDLYVENPGRGRKRQIMEPGIQISTATMPCGESIKIELSYGTGNANRLYFLFDFNDASPDEGRKTYDDTVEDIAQKVAKHYTGNVFVKNRRYLIPKDDSHGPTESEQEMSVQSTMECAREKDDLPVQNLGLKKEPAVEQEVVSLFTSLVAGGSLKGYEILSVHGSAEKYDGVLSYYLEPDEVIDSRCDSLDISDDSFGSKEKIKFDQEILEFKYDADALVTDFEESIKAFDDIRLLVCWDIGDKQAFEDTSNYRLKELDSSNPKKQFHGETHLMTKTVGQNKVHVIVLKDVIEDLADEIS